MSKAVVRVGDISQQLRGVSYGKGDARSTPDAGFVPILRAGNIADAGLTFEDLVFVHEKRVADKQRLRAGDVLIAASSGSLDVVGKAAPALFDYEGAFGAFCKVLRPNCDLVAPNYFAHFFKTDRYRKTVSRLAEGANINNLKSEHLNELAIPLPSLSEQRRIATILDLADTIRAKRREALAQLDRLAQAIFVEMFGDPLTNPKSWPEVELGELGNVVTGNTPSREDLGNFGDAIEWIKSDNLNTPHYYVTRAAEGLSDLGRRRARTVPASSVLVTCIAGSPDCIGNCAMTDREVAFNQQINAFVPRRGNPHYYLALFKTGKKLIQRASTNGMKGMVSKGRFEQIRVMLPPVAMQEAFAERALTVVAIANNLWRSQHNMDALFASLQHRAFRGDL